MLRIVRLRQWWKERKERQKEEDLKKARQKPLLHHMGRKGREPAKKLHRSPP